MLPMKWKNGANEFTIYVKLFVTRPTDFSRTVNMKAQTTQPCGIASELQLVKIKK
jgi:hypothetical protein